MPLRIRFEQTRYAHIGARSGYGQLVRHLDPAGHEAILHGATDGDDDLPQWLAPFKQRFLSMIRRGRMPWYKLSDLNAEAEAFAKAQTQQVDILHYLDGEHSGQFIPKLARNSPDARIRTVATFHQPPDLLAQLVNPELLRCLDAVVLVSPSQLQFFTEHVDPDRLHVILHGVDSQFFYPAPSRTPERITCVTGGHWLRDWETFRNVALRLPDVSFAVVGGPQEKLEGPSNVIHHAGISDEALADLYRGSDILFLPLIDSTANNALLEGIASGLPVVATDLEAIRAYLPGTEGIFVPRSRTDDFVEAIKRLQEDTTLRHVMGQQARRRAEQLDWRLIAAKYEELYAGLCSAERPEPVADANPALSRHSIPLLSPVEERLGDAPVFGPSRPTLTELGGISSWGLAMLDAGLTREATLLFDGLKSAASNDHRALAGAARAAEARWQWAEAIAEWDASLAVNRSDPAEAIAGKSRCLVEIGRLSEARALLWSISGTFDGLAGLAAIAALTGPPDLALASWEKCITQFPDRVEGFLNKASQLVETARFDEAEELIAHMLGIWPKCVDAQVCGARAAVAAGDRKLASDRWKAILGQGSVSRSNAAQYAQFLAAVGDDEGVDAYLERIASDMIASAEFLMEHAIACGKWPAAVEQARRLSALDSDDPARLLRIASLLAGRKNTLDAAIIILNDLMMRSPDSVAIKTYLIDAQIRSGAEEDALETLRTIPHDDTRLDVEALRVWAAQRDRDNHANEVWKAIFIDFGMLHRTPIFAGSSLRLQSSP